MNEDIQEVLDELYTVRPEMLDEKGKRLFEAIMKIADERDLYKQETERLNNIINEINCYCFKRMSELNDIQERDEKLQDFCDNKINAFIEVREKIKDLKGSDKE